MGECLAIVECVSIHGRLVEEDPRHWQFLTQGLSTSGGMEFSLRVQAEKDEVEPPRWAVRFLATLVAHTNRGVVSGDSQQLMVLAQGIAPGAPSQLRAVVFISDPCAGQLVPSSARVKLVLAVPLTRDEIRTVREWSPDGLLEVLSKANPWLITHLDRPSLLESPRARATIEQRLESEGSSMSTMTAVISQASKVGELVTWKLSSEAVEAMCSLLKGRLGHQRPFTVVSGSNRVEVKNGDRSLAVLRGRQLTLSLTHAAARQFRALLGNERGTWTFDQLPNFALRVV